MNDTRPAETSPADADTPAPAEPRARRYRLRLSILPTLCTLGNSVCGFLAICYASDANALHALRTASAAAGEFPPTSGETASGKLAMAGWMILLGMVFDALDGRLARLTRSTSEFGGALDSLADVVTFGMAPAIIAKTLCQDVLGWGSNRVAFATAAFFAACATLRLARYNAEHEEPDQAVNHFTGLPTPGAAGVIAGIAFCHEQVLGWLDLSAGGKVLVAQVISYGFLTGLGLLMVSRVPFIHFANRFLAGRKPVGRLALLLLVGAIMIATEAPAVVLAGLFLAYGLSGPLSVIPRLFRRRADEAEANLFE